MNRRLIPARNPPRCASSANAHRIVPLYLPLQIPIIVAMKIWFRTLAEQGVPQTRPEDRPVPPPSSWSPPYPVLSGTPPTQNPTESILRRGAACCARCRAADQRHSLATSRSIPAVSWLRFQQPPARPQTAPATQKPRENGQLSDQSNRFWPENRSYRKQTIKPCLTGARTAFSGSGILRGVRVRCGGRKGMVQRDCRVSES
jgi:hypothetical protein